MPRYHFDIRDGQDVFTDDDGMDLPDMDTAIGEARRTLADMMRDSLRNDGGDALSIAIRAGADGPVIVSVRFNTSRPDQITQ
jgi:hypothetical protein